MKVIIFFIGFLIFPLIFWGQSMNAALRFTNYSVANGLPTNNVNSIIRDSRGFVWMGTAQGLVRFDGNNFFSYNHNRSDINSMPFDDVSNCIELNNHELIFNCGGKMWMLNTTNGKQHPPPLFWKSKTETTPKKLSEQLIIIKSQDKFYFTDYNLTIIDSLYAPILKEYYSAYYLGENRVLFSDNHRMFCYAISKKILEEWKFDEVSFKPLSEIYVKDVDTLNKKIYIAGYSSGVYTMSYDIAAPDYLKSHKESIPFLSAIKDICYKS